MRILYVANGLPPTAVGGVEQYTLALAQAQAQHHQVAILCREYAPEQGEYTLLDQVQAGLRVRRIVNNFRDVSSLESHYRNAAIERLFCDYVQEIRPDLIHFQHCIGLSAGLPGLAQQAGIPYVLTLHDYWYICPTTRLLTRDLALCAGPHHGADCRQCLGAAIQVSSVLHRLPFYAQLRDALLPRALQRVILRRLERLRPARTLSGAAVTRSFIERVRYMQQMLNSIPLLVAFSHFCRNVYVDYGLRAEAIRVIPAGMDLERWKNRPRRAQSPKLRFGYIGTQAAHKGIDVLVRAFRQIQRDDIELHLFGPGAPGDSFATQLEHLAAGDRRICFEGRYDNERLPELLAGIDVVVIPSRWHETFSIVARESLLAGAAVVASSVGAIPEVIQDGVNGLLAPPGDEVALAGILERLADDRGLLERLAQAAAMTPIKSMATHTAEVEAIYEEVCEAWSR